MTGDPAAEGTQLSGTMTREAAEMLRAQFPPELIGKLPRANIELDYVGHADVTDRLLQVDPLWTWEPMGQNPDGSPVIGRNDKGQAVLWLRLTVLGVTRPGVGCENAGVDDLEKKLVSDALRNAAMRFGVALDLWSKQRDEEHNVPEPGSAATSRSSRSSRSGSSSRGRQQQQSAPAAPAEGMVERRAANRELLDAYLALGLSDDEAKAEVKAAWKARHLGDGPIPRRLVDDAVANAAKPPATDQPAACEECGAPLPMHRGGCSQAPFEAPAT